jgi:general secretion pathway protein I
MAIFYYSCIYKGELKKDNKQKGFTLLETLVALSVLAISLGVTYQVFSSALQGSTLADDYAQASMYADSHLAEIGQSVNSKTGVTEGSYNERYHWKLEVKPLDVASSKPVVETVKRYQVVLNVYWQTGNKQRSIRAMTFRLASA